MDAPLTPSRKTGKSSQSAASTSPHRYVAASHSLQSAIHPRGPTSIDGAAVKPATPRKQINDTRLLKQQLMQELSVSIAKHHLKQAEAAEILMVSRPRVSDVVNKKTAKFTIDTLVEMLSRVGKPVRLAVG
jgi:predicted XRE-type DNA-binding protein